MTHRIRFNVYGWCTQDIELLTEKYNVKKIVDLLNEGELVTTMTEGGESFIEDMAGNQVARIMSQDNECTYDDFDYET